MKHEYHEGQEALEKFKRGMKKLFQVPKGDGAKEQQVRRPATSRKSNKSGKDKA